MNTEQFTNALNVAPLVTHNPTTDGTPAIVVQYVPNLGSGGSTATCAVNAGTSITFLVDGSTPSGDDAIGSNGVIDISDAAYDTMGEVYDEIVSNVAYRAYLCAALRADKSSWLKTAAAASCMGDNGLVLYYDTDANDGVPHGCVISGEKFVNNGYNGHLKDSVDGDKNCINQMLSAAVNVGSGNGTLTLKFYTGKQGSAETQIGPSITLTEDTQKLISDTNVLDPYIQATNGQRLIVRVEPSSTFDSIAEFSIVGRTGVLDGSRIVDEVNY